MLADLVFAIELFMEFLTKDNAPALDPKRDLYIPSGEDAEEWINYATDYRLYDQQIKSYEEKIRPLKEKRDRAQEAMQGMMGEFLKAEFAGVGITRFKKRGVIDYDEYLKDNPSSLSPSVDVLEKYRKESKTQSRVTVTDQAMPRNIIDEDVRSSLGSIENGAVKVSYF